MPQDKNLDPVKLPMQIRFDEAPTTQFVNEIDALRVELIDSPDPVTVRQAVYSFVKATWADKPVNHRAATSEELSRIMEDVFGGRALPAAMELIGLTFLVGGIDTQTVTHLIRHRTGTFAAQCTGDRWLTHERCLVPESVQNSPEFYERWRQHVEEAKELYCDMVDSRQISLMDARRVLPKCLETFYYVRMNVSDALRFIKQRQDKAIQPQVDNIMAALFAREILRIFPEAHVAINLEEPAWHFIKTFRNGTGTNLYWPESQNDKFDYNPSDSIYQAVRDDVNGTGSSDDLTLFRRRWQAIVSEVDDIVSAYKRVGYHVPAGDQS